MVDEVHKAEGYSRKRATLFPVLAVMLIIQNGAFMAGGGGNGSNPLLTGVAWMGLALTLIFLVATGGYLYVGRSIRDLMNDEAVVETRRKANSLGFLNSALTAVLLYALTYLREFSAREAIVIIFGVGMSSALLSFGIWERKALEE